MFANPGMVNISIVFGTRPEAIKLAPVALALQARPGFKVRIVLTGQHREMTRGILDWFGLSPDIDLDIMEKDQSLSSVTARCAAALDKEFAGHPPQIVLAQGDTTSAFVACLIAFYHKAKIGHVEAGLRTGDRDSPWPEEMNRRLITQLADYHFAPTVRNVEALKREGVAGDDILLSGNTVIDALEFSVRKVKEQKISPPMLREFFEGDGREDKVVLITGHRRENFGPGFESICKAITTLAERYPSYRFIYPVHLNPNVRKTVFEWLGHTPNIRLIEPLGYPEFVSLMERSFIILTDSGGVQEEAPSLRKPVIVFRGNTERPEAVEVGMVVVVGTAHEKIIEAFTSIADDPARYASMTQGRNPYGDGAAASRIAEFLAQRI